LLQKKRIKMMEGHLERLGALAWNGDAVSSGIRDVGTPGPVVGRLAGHHGEVKRK
jgi:hypothetical protein